MLEGGKGKRKTEKGEPLSKFVPFRFVFFLGGGGGGIKLRSQDLGCCLSNNRHTALPSTSTPAPPKVRKSTHLPSSPLSMIGACVSVILWGRSIATACVSLLTSFPEPAYIVIGRCIAALPMI